MLRRKASCFPAAGFLFLTTVLSLLADSLCQRPTPTGSNAAERHARHSQAIVSVDKHGSSLDVADSSSSKLDGGENGRPSVHTVTEYSRGDVSYPKETTNLDAIVMLHSLLDDDHNGNVDPSESNEFLRDELQYTSGYERSAAVFHGGDKLVSVDDLWRTWRMSSVYNWTVEDVVEWLVYHVELPQYADLFTLHSVDGTQLPRLATNNYNYISAILGIKNPVHKQKLSLKATDVVLFGPPKKGHSYVKDAAVVTSLVVAVVGCWFAYYQHRYSKGQVRRMMKDMESLQKAEDTLTEMQNKLEKAEKEQMSVSEEKKNLEQKYREEIETAKVEAERLKIAREGSLEEMSRLKLAEEELKQVRSALKRAEKQLELRQGVIPAELQPYLQLTHEIELQNYHSKRQAAEKQLVAARDECERIRRKRNTVMGALRMNSVDEVDQRIATARAALEEVRVTLTERLHRWAAMEHLCGFNIVTNNGLASLCARLQRDILPSGIVAYGLAGAARSTMAIPFLGPAKLEVDMDVNEDLPPSYSTATVVSPVEVLKKVSGCGGVLTKRGNSKDGSRRSSLSTIPDESNLNDNNSAAADARVTFNLGENSGEEKVNTSPKSHIHNGVPSVNGKMTKSKSHYMISNQGVNGASILNGVDMSSRRSDPNLSRPRGNSLTSDSLSGAESTDSAAETEKRKGEKDKKRRKFLHNFLKKDKSS